MLLALILALTTSCNSGKKGKGLPDRPGRYVEIDVSPPFDGWFMSFVTGDGAIVCFSAGLQMRYDSADGGETWSASPGPASFTASSTERYLNVRSGTLLPDGRLLTYIQGEGLILISPDGRGERYPVADIDAAAADGKTVSVTILQSLGNDRLLIAYSIMEMSVIGGRPIGQPNQSGGARIDASASPEGAASVIVTEGAGSVTVIDAVPVSGDGSQGDSAQTPGEGAQSGGPQRQDPQGNASDSRGGTTAAFSNSMLSKVALFELSGGRLIAELPIEFAIAATADDETLYVMDGMGSMTKYNLSDGSQQRGSAVNLSGGRGGSFFTMPGMSSGLLAVSGDSGVYALYDGDLLLCEDGGSVYTALEGTAYSIGSPNGAAVSVFALEDGSFIVNMLDNMETNHLYRYVWDENAEINPDKTLSVWSLEENAFVRAAITELRRRNPDSLITYEVAMDGASAVSPTDAINTLNTRLLSGSGPDVIILDDCPADSYAGRGILMDLSSLVDVGDVYRNFISPYMTDGSMFSIPTQFYMPALIGSAEALDNARTLDDLVRLVVNGNDTAVIRPGAGMGPFSGLPEGERAELYFDDLGELCKIMWMSGAPAIIRDNTLDTDALRQYLTAIKSISDKYSLTGTDDEFSMGMGVAFSSGGRATVLSGSLVRYTSQMTNMGAFAAGNLMLLQLTMDRDGSAMAPFPGLVSGAWRPSTVAGISADTSVADFAVEFLRTMLSVEVQQINCGVGLPVTAAGIEAQIRAMNELMDDMDREPFNLDMDAIIATLISPSVNDTTLTDMMWGSVERLCRGEIDVEGAVREIEQNVKNYLAERA